MPKVVVLGAGMVGGVIATDLAADPSLEVWIADASSAALERASQRAARLGVRLGTLRVDLSDPAAVHSTVLSYDMVAGALPSRIAFGALRAVVEAGKNFCDISFMAEDPLELDAVARARGVTAVVDCGVAPGMSHILAARGAAEMDRAEEVEMYVGGLPLLRRWPYQYKAAFSPSDVIEEYTRPARLVEQGRVVVREALSEPELMDFDGVGTLEAFNTDGLRSMARTYLGRVPNMKEKTLRYPGHIELMRVLRQTGLMGEQPVEVGGVMVRPRDLLARLMFPMWTYEPGEADLTVMRVRVRGVRDGKPAVRQWDVLDHMDPATQTTSMARTTAYPCAIMTRLILAGKYKRPGIVVPELIGEDDAVVQELLRQHSARGVVYRASSGAPGSLDS